MNIYHGIIISFVVVVRMGVYFENKIKNSPQGA